MAQPNDSFSKSLLHHLMHVEKDQQVQNSCVNEILLKIELTICVNCFTF